MGCYNELLQHKTNSYRKTNKYIEQEKQTGWSRTVSVYKSQFARRQLDIIEERIPLSKVRLNKLTLLMRKACVFGDKEIEEVVSIMRKKKTDPNYYEPNMTDEEATRILTELLSSKR